MLLFSELQLLRKSLPEATTKAMDVLEYIKYMHICLSHAWVAYIILLTISVTIATAEISFSNLKLIKKLSSLNSTMSEDRLSGLTMLSIEKKVLVTLDYNDVITNFALQKQEE